MVAAKVTLAPVLAATTAASIAYARKFEESIVSTVMSALTAVLPLYFFVW
jgi:hypothetical protein